MLREQHRTLLLKNIHGLTLLDSLFERPHVDVKRAAEVMQCSIVTAGKVVRDLQKQGVLEEMTGQARNRVFRYQPYLALFENQALE
jgi:Fic family protein